MIEPRPGEDRWLTPGVRGIGLASLLSDLGHEIPTALLPSFLTSVLGAPAFVLGGRPAPNAPATASQNPHTEDVTPPADGS